MKLGPACAEIDICSMAPGGGTRATRRIHERARACARRARSQGGARPAWESLCTFRVDVAPVLEALHFVEAMFFEWKHAVAWWCSGRVCAMLARYYFQWPFQNAAPTNSLDAGRMFRVCPCSGLYLAASRWAALRRELAHRRELCCRRGPSWPVGDSSPSLERGRARVS